MKKRLKVVSYLVVVVLSLSVVLPSSNIGFLGADVVSAATESTTTTTTSNTSTNGYGIVKIGYRGENVKTIQTLLNSNGYDIKVDGIFGKETLAAVKDFQSKNGLVADGMVGPKTYEALNKVTATEEPEDTETETSDVEELDVTNIKMGRVDYAPHGDKTFAVVVAAMLGDKIVGTSIDEYQFMGADVATGVPSSDGAFGEKYPEGYVLGSKRTNTEYYSGNMATKAGSTTPIHENFNAIEAYATGKTISELEETLANNTAEEIVDVVSGATLRDTKGYLTSILEAAKEALGLLEEEVDVVTTASITNDAEGLKKAISKDGTWIIATLNDITTDEELVIEGDFYNKNDPTRDLYRKIAPYTQDDDHNIIDIFKITAPKLTVKSPNTRLQGGAFVGDVYVEANGFNLKDAAVEGNIYFAKQEYKDSFAQVESEVTGNMEVLEAEEVDVVTTASITNDVEGLKKAISKDGTWIIATLNDIVSEEELVIEGKFYNKDDETRNIYRKLAPYTQDDDHNVIDRFKITAPKLTVKSPNTRIQNGTFVGDIYVEANGFNLKGAKVDGNVYYTKAEYKGSSLVKQEDVTGEIEVLEADVVSTASIKYDAEGLKKAISKDGTWIIAILNDIITDEELVVEGDFYNKNDPTRDLYRKLAPYTQDDDHNVIDRFKITAPKLTIKSPNTRLQAGSFAGDIYVEANGFNLTKGAKVDGNIYFASEEYKASFEQNECEVTGEIAVK